MLRPKLRLIAIVIVVVPVVLVGLPVQAALIRFAPQHAGRIPVLFHRIMRWLLGLRVTVTGAPAQGGPVLIVANHVSWLDIVALGSVAPLSFVAKSEIAGWPVIGWLAKLQRSVFVDRARKSETAAVNRDIAQRLAAGEAIVLFPEGTTGDGNRLQRFRSALLGAVCDSMAASQEVQPAHDTQPAQGSPAQGTLPIRVQPVSIVYARVCGMPAGRHQRPELAWYGDMELAPHLLAFLALPGVDARISFGEPVEVTPEADRKTLAGAMETAIRRMRHEAANGRSGAGPANLPVNVLAEGLAATPVATDRPQPAVLLGAPPSG